ncbi:phage terminase large subunit [uncultured Planococcus sp.]|uniref:phage terminase large subunit n=1 Tax=uncultured Planococcus sp. TaxID=337815 RepID=UPI0026341939|nr:phage terminase large subunit [uncultured Planococcus sp.]
MSTHIFTQYIHATINGREAVIIAWLSNAWLDRPARQARIDELTSILDYLNAEFPAVDDMPDDLTLQYFEVASELAQLARVHRCEVDQLEFALEYFSDARNPGNDGNWEGFDTTHVDEAPTFHRELTELMNVVSNVERNAKVAAAAPRSHAKSTYLSKNFPVHQVVYRLRKYIIIISETPNVSKANMEWIRNQLKFNVKLRQDFGPLLSPRDQANLTDNSEEFIAWHATDGDSKRQLTLVQAASTGQALRGRNWNGSRPDLIVCDDLEDARPGGNASTEDQRMKLREWFSQTVMPLGDPKGKRTAFVVMGTTVHWSSLLMTILHKRSDFQSRIYRAIIDEPANAKLWEQCRQLYIDRDNPDRLAATDAFYDANEPQLLEGSRVLWPDVQPLYKLMRWKWDNGSKAFNTEYMNNPVDEESQVFAPATFTYWTDKNELDGVDVAQSQQYDVAMGVDMAMGKQRGDFSAITVIARHRTSGVEYVIESYGERVKPNVFIDEVVKRVIKYQPHLVGAEAQAAQEFFVDQLKEALEAAGYPAGTRVKKIYQRMRKEMRIEAMIPDIESGKLRFNRSHTQLLEQFERYGSGTHDDLIDATEIAKSVLKRAAITLQQKPSWL